MKISVLTPTYNSLSYLKETLDSLFSQTYQDFELIICNDSENDKEELPKFLEANYSEFKHKIKYEQNEKNLGYALNMRKCFEKSEGKIVFLLAQDDIILDPNLFSKTIEIYENNPTVGFVVRPYFWFDYDIKNKLRRTPKSTKRIIENDDSVKHIHTLITTLGQLSGLSFRRYPNIHYHFTPYIFTAHVYPFLQNFLVSDCYFMKEDTIAVRMSSSQTTFVSSIYNPSPTLTWIQMSDEIFKSHSYLRNIFRDHFSTNYLGLVQIKNYGYFKDLLSDIKYLIKFRPKNLLNPVFWGYVLGVIFIPKKLLIFMVNFFKQKINSRVIA